MEAVARAISVQLPANRSRSNMQGTPTYNESLVPSAVGDATARRLVAENDGEFLQFFGGKVFHSGF